MAKKKMNVEEAMDILKTFDNIYQLQTLAKKMCGKELNETDAIMDKFHEAVLVVDNHIATHSIDIVDGGKK